MKVIIMGSTGMIGKSVLLECMASDLIKSILIINRQPIGIQDKKINEIIHDDFNDFSTIRQHLKNYDACFFCLGVSSAGMSEYDYNKITYELTTGFARELIIQNDNLVFCYISGAGTDSSEKGRSMWARVKGKTENALLGMPFKASYMLRPGFIKPKKGIKSRTRLYNLMYSVFTPFYYILNPFGSLVTNTEKLGKAMIRIAEKGYDKKIIPTKDINLIAENL